MTIIDEYLYHQEKYAKKYGSDNTIVFMQIGAFQEAYATNTRGFDLKKLSDLLNLTCTKKDKGVKEVSEKNPYLLGYPIVAHEKYLNRLVSNGYTVVIFEQTTPPPDPKRELTGIYSPGTYINETFTHESNNVMSIYIEDERQINGSFLICIGMSVTDFSTGESTVYEVLSKIDDDTMASDEAVRFINSYAPKEILVFRKKTEKALQTNNFLNKNRLLSYLELNERRHIYTEKIEKKWDKLSYQNAMFQKVYDDTGMCDSSIEYLDLEHKNYARLSFLLLIEYAYEHNENIIKKLHKPQIFEADNHLILGNNALFQLNVIETPNIDSGSSKFKSLFHVINKTSTAMGKRYLKNKLINPDVDIKLLNSRYDLIEYLIDSNDHKIIHDIIYDIVDVERLHKKLSIQMIHPFEFKNFITSMGQAQKMIKFYQKNKKYTHILPDKKIMKNLDKFLASTDKLYSHDMLEKYSLNSIENSVFVNGVYKNIDLLQNKINTCIKFMNDLCSILSSYIVEPVKTSKTNKSKSKKVKIIENDITEEKDNKIKLLHNERGHYLSLTKIRAALLSKNLPDSIVISENIIIRAFELRITNLAKGNTQITCDKLKSASEELKEYQIQMAQLVKEEYVKNLKKYQTEFGFTIRKTIELVSLSDFLQSSAQVAIAYNYCKPIANKSEKSYIECTNLRHPTVERINTETEYIPHNIQLGKNGLDGMLIFGINSAGKSVLMKAVGLSIIMAQSGMFVPAINFTFSPYTSLFARITGNDNMHKGLSSFALEMTELKSILKRVGPNTLVIGDEVCRGTEHISGNAIVASSLITISKSGSSFLFATHLHEIPEIDEIKQLSNVKSFHLTVEHDKKTDTLIFDRILKEGPGESIYGITIAKYIIDDDEFIKTAQNIRNKLIGKPLEYMSSKQSRYNSNLYMDRCGVCKTTFDENNKVIGYLETHHINHQKNCKKGFVKSKPHVLMNSKPNETPLCKKCHIKHHKGNLPITGYDKTSKGIKLNYKEIDADVDTDVDCT